MNAILNKITRGFIILVMICIPVLFCTSAVHCAVAAESKQEINSNYASDLVDNNKWGKEVIEKSEGYGDSSKSLVSGANDFLYKIGTILIMIACIASVARLAGRGILDMTKNTDPTDKSASTTFAEIPMLFKSGTERKSNTRSETWAREMLIETGIFFLIAIAAGTIIALLLGIYNFVMEGVFETAPKGLTSFDAPGGISVDSTVPKMPTG